MAETLNKPIAAVPTLKIGLIGCGRIARLVHLNILAFLPGVELIALAEPDPQRREEASRVAQGAVVFTDYQELVALPDVQAVVICLPNGLHEKAAIAALEARKHVYLEKPLATNLKEGERILRAWRDTRSVGMIGFNYRFHELYRTAKRHIQSGRLGKLIGARSVFCTTARRLPSWKQQRETGGGVLLDLASHHVDLVRFLFDREIDEVFASVNSEDSNNHSAMLQLRLAGGLGVQSFVSMSSVEEDRFEVYGSEAKLALDRHHSLNVEITDLADTPSRFRLLRQGVRSLVRSPYLLEKFRAPSREPSYQASLAHFVTSVQTSRSASPDFWDGYRSLAVVEAAEKSAMTGQIISLPDVFEESRNDRKRSAQL
jgi:predicted dehydrogenase